MVDKYGQEITNKQWGHDLRSRVPGSNPGGGWDFFLGLKGAPELTQLGICT